MIKIHNTLQKYLMIVIKLISSRISKTGCLYYNFSMKGIMDDSKQNPFINRVLSYGELTLLYELWNVHYDYVQLHLFNHYLAPFEKQL